MRYATTALRCWLTAAALLLALCCPLPVFAARAGAVHAGGKGHPR